MTIYEKLSAIQAELKVPKDQRNDYGGFNYRSCEDILEKVKPICQKQKTVLFLNDELIYIGDRYYIHATAELMDLESKDSVSACGIAREEESKKGMDGSQVTGASSSYARKYALNGLFCIDDVKDSDFTNTGDKPQQEKKGHTECKRPREPKNADTGTFCADCGTEISDKVSTYSFSKFGKPLCMNCQKNHAHR